MGAGEPRTGTLIVPTVDAVTVSCADTVPVAVPCKVEAMLTVQEPALNVVVVVVPAEYVQLPPGTMVNGAVLGSDREKVNGVLN